VASASRLTNWFPAKNSTSEHVDPPLKESIRIKGEQMAWKAPKIVEVPVGMEINMYMCATRK
jgi:coenzyme PQQ precursor peptide PqqA